MSPLISLFFSILTFPADSEPGAGRGLRAHEQASKAPALKLPVISFLCVNMCFLSGARRREEKQARREL